MVAGYGHRAFGDQSFRVLVVRSPLLGLGSPRPDSLGGAP